MFSWFYAHILNLYHFVDSALATSQNYPDSGLFIIQTSAPENKVGGRSRAAARASQLHWRRRRVKKKRQPRPGLSALCPLAVQVKTSLSAMLRTMLLASSQVPDEALSRAKNQLKSLLMHNLESRAVTAEDLARCVVPVIHTQGGLGPHVCWFGSLIHPAAPLALLGAPDRQIAAVGFRMTEEELCTQIGPCEKPTRPVPTPPPCAPASRLPPAPPPTTRRGRRRAVAGVCAQTSQKPPCRGRCGIQRRPGAERDVAREPVERATAHALGAHAHGLFFFFFV